MEAIKELNQDLRIIKSYNDKSEYEDQILGKRFNLFRIIKKGHEEVSLHSAFIGELLKPNGIHKNGNIFLNKFIEKIVNDENRKFKTDSDYRVFIEKSFSYGRMDIVIENDNDCIIIENKIHAGDRPMQLGRYNQYSKQFKNSSIIYLTLHGNDPSDQTLMFEGKKIDTKIVKNISYKDDIRSWLEECLLLCLSKSYIRENIMQYIDLLRDLTNTLENKMISEIKNYIKNEMDIDSLNQIDHLTAAIDSLRFDSIKMFIKKVTSIIDKNDHVLHISMPNIVNSKYFTKSNINGSWKVLIDVEIKIENGFLMNINIFSEGGHSAPWIFIDYKGSNINKFRDFASDKNHIFKIEEKNNHHYLKILISNEGRIDFSFKNDWVKSKYINSSSVFYAEAINNAINLFASYTDN